MDQRSKGAGDEDMVLDSPNWLASRLAELRARDFERVNDPRRLDPTTNPETPM